MLHVLCCPIKISVPFNPSSVWILFQNVSSQHCFSFLIYILYVEIFFEHCVIGVKLCMVELYLLKHTTSSDLNVTEEVWVIYFILIKSDSDFVQLLNTI